MSKQTKRAAVCAAAGLFALVAGSSAALAAQSTEAAASQNSMSGAIAPDSKFARQPGTLSDKLDKSNGVIRPKEVDPAIEKKAPSTGTAAVIPPPGSPGGPQGVQPK